MDTSTNSIIDIELVAFNVAIAVVRSFYVICYIRECNKECQNSLDLSNILNEINEKYHDNNPNFYTNSVFLGHGLGLKKIRTILRNSYGWVFEAHSKDKKKTDGKTRSTMGCSTGELVIVLVV